MTFRVKEPVVLASTGIYLKIPLSGQHRHSEKADEIFWEQLRASHNSGCCGTWQPREHPHRSGHWPKSTWNSFLDLWRSRPRAGLQVTIYLQFFWAEFKYSRTHIENPLDPANNVIWDRDIFKRPTAIELNRTVWSVNSIGVFYQIIRLTNFKSSLWTCATCYMETEHTTRKLLNSR